MPSFLDRIRQIRLVVRKNKEKLRFFRYCYFLNVIAFVIRQLEIGKKKMENSAAK